jgi:uncharacterized protein
LDELGKLLAERLTGQPLTTAAFAGRTRLLVLQGTPFCNLRCDYCYLPDRDERRRMPAATAAAAVAFLHREELAADDLTIVWHAGEPLVLPPAWYRHVFAAIAAEAPAGKVQRHAMQTNGVLVDEAWCDFFLTEPVAVGISLDGPAFLHDARRHTRSGGPTHARVMGAAALLQRRGVPFHAIAVVGAATLSHADAFADFFLDHGIADVGLNIEEIEGVNGASTLAGGGSRAAFRRFLDRLCDRAAASGGRLRLREMAAFAHRFARFVDGAPPRNDQVEPFAIVTVTTDGELSTFSPELAGLGHPRLGRLSLGNVRDLRLADVLAGERFRALHDEVRRGVDACRRDCRHFGLCGGGAPANKLAEHGSFDATETLYCRLVHQDVAEVLLRRLERAVTA